MRRLLEVLAVLAWTLLRATVACAAPPDEIERRITDELRAIDPGQVDLFLEANQASERGDHELAARLYGEVFSRAPAFVHAERRQCRELVAVGHHEEGVALCRKSLKADASVFNLAGLAAALVSKPGKEPLSSAEAAEVEKLLDRGYQLEDGNEAIAQVECQYALRQNRLSLLKRCTERLARNSPNGPGTIYFSWVLAMSEGQWGDAEDLIARGRRAQLPPDLLKKMEQSLAENRPFWHRWLGVAGWVVAGWAGIILVLTLAGLALSRATLRHAESLSTSPATESATLRRVYAGVLVFCCALYYASLPLVLLAVLGAGGGVIYATIAFGHIPIKLVLLMALMIFVTFAAVIKSLFLRSSDNEPGLKLDLSKESNFRQALDEVAARIGTRPVDTVYVTPDTSIAVFERKHGERCLLLGAAVMEGMPLLAFKAILAHEYGHFSNRDTAGGGFALRVRRSLLTFIVHLAQSGQARVWNPAWWFAKGFYLLFLRISQGASRLQEILADRHAALAYGGDAFARGLRHVIHRAIAFDAHAESEVQRAVKSGTPLLGLWRRSELPGEAASKADEELNRPPSPYDSHPSPRDRIRWVGTIVGQSNDAARDDTSMVWELFRDRAWLEREMTLVIYQRLAMQGIRLPPLPAA